MLACIIAFVVPLFIVIWTYFKNADKLMSQIPGARAIAYSGVIILTFIDVASNSCRTGECLSAAVIMASVFEIGSYARDKYRETKKKSKASN